MSDAHEHAAVVDAQRRAGVDARGVSAGPELVLAGAASAVRPSAPLTANGLRSLQRQAGNRAAGLVVQRQSAPPAAPARTPIVGTRSPAVSPGDGPGAPLQDVTGDSSGGPGAPVTDPGPSQDSGGGPATPGAPVIPPPPQPGMWTTLIADLGGGANAARDALELLRPIPGLGMLPGIAADTIGMVTDQQQFKGLDEPWTQMLTGLRDITALTNNLLGSASSAVETVQDVATASVVGAELDVVTAPVELSIKQIKLYVDGFQLGLDVFGAAAAAYNASNSPKNSDELTKNNQILQMFEANIVGDVVGGVIDVIDVATAGFANGDNVKGVGKFLYSFLKAAGPVGRALVSALNGWFGVHGGAVLPASSGTVAEPTADWHPAPPAAQRLAGDDSGVGAGARLVFAQAVSASMDEAQGMWQTANTGLVEAIDLAHRLEAGAREKGTELNGGKDPFLQIRDSAHRSLDTMHHHVAELTDLHRYAGGAQDKADALNAGADTALAAVDRIHLPQVHLPRQQGDGVLDSVLNAGADMADSAFQALLTPPRLLLETAQAGVRAPIESAKAHVQEGAKFAQFLQDFAQQAINSLTDKIASFSAGIAKVENGGQFIDLMLHQVTEMMGIPGGVGLDDARAQWDHIGQLITQGQGMAQELLRSAQAGGGGGGATPAQRLATPGAALPDGDEDPSP